MSTQDNDPFAATPQAAQPGTPEPSATPPGVLAPGTLPGTLPGAAPAAPPMPGAVGAPAAFPNYAPTQPVSGLAKWAIIGTGAYTAFSILGAVMAPGTLERTKTTLADPENAGVDVASSLFGIATFGISIASFVLLALWMWRVRGNLTAMGRKPGGPPAVEWWGWFIPVANLILPALGMRAITKGIIGVGRLLAWWVPFAATTLVAGWATFAQIASVDFVTGEITNEELLNSTVPVAVASAALVTVSWIFLVQIISKTTREHVPGAN